jgi:hypothetical protein
MHNLHHVKTWVDTEIPKRKGQLDPTSSNGAIRPLSAEQLLSHILPPLAGKRGHFTVKVEPDNRTEI